MPNKRSYHWSGLPLTDAQKFRKQRDEKYKSRLLELKENTASDSVSATLSCNACNASPRIKKWADVRDVDNDDVFLHYPWMISPDRTGSTAHVGETARHTNLIDATKPFQKLIDRPAELYHRSVGETVGMCCNALAFFLCVAGRFDEWIEST